MLDVQSSATDRRSFLALAAAGIVPAPRATARPAQDALAPPPADQVGEITPATIAEAEKLAAVRYTDAERAVIVGTIDEEIDRFVRRRGAELPNGLGPAQVFAVGAAAPAAAPRPAPARRPAAPPLPASEEDVAFAPAAVLAQWIARGDLSSERLTRLYLDRLGRLGPKLECTVTITADLALEQARRADRALAAGGPRSPLHGVPWGAKDLFDTKGIRTTWGAAPYRERVPDRDALVVQRLEAAGAVLVAKLTLGELAYGDIWFGGKTRNPFDPQRGSSGSSAGPAAATAAGLVGFALGTETLGSIVSPCMRCGTTGLRPTFGRVGRDGAMSLCWSLDKIGPIARTVLDCALVLETINGAGPEDPSSRDVPFALDHEAPVRGRRVGWSPRWFEGRGASESDRAALDALRRLGVELVEIELPDWPYDALMTILLAEAAAAFEELTLSNRDDELVWQEPQSWPNSFRQARFLPAIEYVQAERFRRKVAAMMAERLAGLDAIVSPSFAAALLTITNFTGHPSLTLRSGFRDDGTPRGITLWGPWWGEAGLCTIGMALERELNVWDRRPT